MDVGFLGLGQMGAAIAERLEGGDARLHVFDPNPVAVAPFVLRGAVDAGSAAAVARAAPIVFACLPTAAVSEQVAAEVAASRTLRIYVEMSTIGSAAMARIAQSLAVRGITLVDCPISGGPKGARAGTLSVIAAGPRAALDEIRPLLARIGRNVFEVGERPGQAQLMKLVNNLISAANMAAAFEALVLGAKGGLDPGLDGGCDQRVHRPQQRHARQGAEGRAARDLRLRREGLHDGEGYCAGTEGGRGAGRADVGARNGRAAMAVWRDSAGWAMRTSPP